MGKMSLRRCPRLTLQTLLRRLRFRACRLPQQALAVRPLKVRRLALPQHLPAGLRKQGQWL